MTIGDSMHKLLIESSNTAMKICPGSLPFSITHAKVLFRLARYTEALETCHSALSIPGINDDNNKKIWVLKGKIMKSQDAMSLASVKHQIQELQEQKEEIQERAITRRTKIEILRPHPSCNTVQLKNYWQTMNMDLKKKFLKIQMADLKRHFDHDRLARDALEGLKEIKIWKVWHCWCNSHSMFYSENLMQHILNEHLCTSQNFLGGNNSTELESFYKICKSSEKWRPVDVAAAVKIMQDLSRNEQGDQGQYTSKVFMNQDEWPYCNDSKREEIINKIQERLREFLNIGWFDSSQISVFMDLIMDMMKKQIPEPLLKEHRTNCTLLWVCFLDISGLNRVFMFLDDLYNICGLQSLCKSHVKDEVRDDPCVANFEKITFNEDFSWVAFDNRMLRGELFVPNDGFAFRFSADDEIELNDDECKDAIVDWLLSGDTSIEEELKQYTSFALYSKIQAKELFNICKAEFQRMQNIRAIKSKYLKELEHWKYLEYQWKQIEEFPYLDSRASPFKSFLLERQKEINADTYESDIIFDILSEEQEQDNKIILVIRNQIDDMTEKVCYRQIYEHVKFSKLFDVKFNVLCEILYMLASIAWCPLHTLTTRTDYSCTMPT